MATSLKLTKRIFGSKSTGIYGGIMNNIYHGNIKDTLIFTKEPMAGEERVYDIHRIPGIIITKKDTVIVYCEARTNIANHRHPNAFGDYNLMDIYMRRSTDSGETFSEPFYLVRGDESESGYACVNNPVMIVGNDNTIHFLYCKDYSINGGGLWYRRSYDDGISWTEPREITNFENDLGHKYSAFAFGPTHGICTADGILCCGVWEVASDECEVITNHWPSRTHICYSTDGGESWHLTKDNNFPYELNSNETCLALLSDGRSILINARNKPGNRALRTYYNFPSGEMGEYTLHDQLIDPACCGGTCSVDIEGLPYSVLYFGCESRQKREFVTVKCSFDDGKTYPLSLPLSGEGFGGYCDIAIDSKGKVYALWEEFSGKNDHLTTFSFADEFIK